METPRALGLGDVPLSWSTSIDGRKRFFILPDSSVPVKIRKGVISSIQRQATNARIQSLNATVTKLAMVKLFREFRSNPRYKDCRIRMMIHDEIVSSCPREIAKEVCRLQNKCLIEASDKYITVVPCEVGFMLSDFWTK